MSDTARIYFDGKGVDAPAAAAVIDALQSVSADAAASVRAGERIITDSRGLPIDADALVYNGAIFRVIRARTRETEEHSESDD